MSNTVAVTERALQPLQDAEGGQGEPLGDQYGWMISGNWGDSMVSAFYPPNMYLRVAPPGRFHFFGASSTHPGGLNVLLADGSARFVKDAIATWPYNPKTGTPAGAITDPSGAWTNLPPPGIWQALATRSGGEVVDQAAY